MNTPLLRSLLVDNPMNLEATRVWRRFLRTSGDTSRNVNRVVLGIMGVAYLWLLAVVLRYHEDLIGNTFLPAIHGGTLGAMLEMAAIFHLLWETETETVPKIVNITVDYLRSARPVDVIASAKVTKQGRRMVNVFAEAWQDDRGKPVATANAHFLVTAADEPSVL